MKKKVLLLVSTIAMAFLIPFSVFAATSDSTVAKNVRGIVGIDFSKLTEEQKADVEEYAEKMAELQKSFMDRMEKNGAISKEDSAALKSRIEERMAQGHLGGLFSGILKDKGFSGRQEGLKNKPDLSKLTEDQKSNLMNSSLKLWDIKRELVQKSATNGLLTQDQAQKLQDEMDACLVKMKENPDISTFGKGCAGMGSGLISIFRNVDLSNLTEQQKKDFQDYATQTIIVKKEILNQLVSYDVISQEQADRMLSGMEKMQNSIIEGEFSKDMLRNRPEGFKGNRKGNERKGSLQLQNGAEVTN